jgi:homocitrate synthase NifV
MFTPAQNRKIHLIDTTLRDGAQSVNVAFTRQDKYNIIKILSDAGLQYFEAGIPVMGNEECADLRYLKHQFPDKTFIGWCRSTLKDIESAYMCGCDTIHISFPVSPTHMSINNYNEKSVLQTLQKLLRKSINRFARVSIGAQDASRANPDFLHSFSECAFNEGAYFVRIADTVGILNPISTQKLFTDLCTTFPGKSFEFHGHNDLGMATANTITALLSGADFASVTVNGIGERAGNAALEEVIMGIHQSTTMSLSFDTSLLIKTCELVNIICKQSDYERKPITGKAIFMHESGMHCNGLLKNKCSYEPYDPLITGHSPTQFFAGTHSGTSGVKAQLGELAQNLNTEELNAFLSYIRHIAAKEKRSLSTDDIRKLFLNKTQIQSYDHTESCR